MIFLYQKLIDLNLFSLRDFDHRMDRTRGRRLGQMATKLYIVLLLLALIVLIVRVIILPDIVTEIVDKPSLNIYNRLLREHDDTLQCSCAFTSSIYDRYVTIQPIFHQVTN